MPIGAKSTFCNALDLKKQGGNTSSYPHIERRHTATLWTSQTGNEVPPKAAPHTVSNMVFGMCSFLHFRFTPGLPFPKLPLAFLTLIEGDNVRQDATGNVLDLMLRNAGIVDELLSASQVAKLPPIFQFCT